MKAPAAVALVIFFYLLHQDVWLWRDSRLVFGFLPSGLFYHAFYTVNCSALLWLLVRWFWPAHLER